MKEQEYKINIIGAGISGLVAAIVLEKHGFHPTIIEATERVGGRVKTDLIDGYQLDHGFQVLLTAYPAAKKYIDYSALELQEFLPGAAIFKDQKQVSIGDPLRDKSLLFPTLFSGIGNLADKLKILKLNNRLKQKSIAEIFSTKEQTTASYLKNLGFSSDMINSFFKPFFSGIFLENQLETSSRMFEFVYKMFGEGLATLPKSGIEEIPKQLAKKLKHTTFRFNTKVSSISDHVVILENGEKLDNHFSIVATEASSLISNIKNQATQWKSCDVFYFETEKRSIQKPLIGLIAKQGSIINNLFYHTSLSTTAITNKELLSVTVVDNKNIEKDELLALVKNELKELCDINAGKLIKHFSIPMALPQLSGLQYEMAPSETRLTTGIFLAGDTQLNGSLNAAMLSGENAALGIIETLTGKVL